MSATDNRAPAGAQGVPISGTSGVFNPPLGGGVMHAHPDGSATMHDATQTCPECAPQLQGDRVALVERIDADLRRAQSRLENAPRDDYWRGLKHGLYAAKRLAPAEATEPRCVKCGSMDIHTAYREKGERLDVGNWRYTADDECLRRYCRGCQYRWTDPVLPRAEATERPAQGEG